MRSKNVFDLNKEYESFKYAKQRFVRIVCVSDTHSRHSWITPIIPRGDVFVHCGDLTFQSNGGLKALRSFNEWIKRLSHKYKIVIGGNHDRMLSSMQYQDVKQNLLSDCIYLENDSYVISEFNDLSIFGCPWSPKSSSDNNAFQQVNKSLLNINKQTIDILVGHSDMSYLDRYKYKKENKLKTEIMTAIKESNVCMHLCGHFHERYGAKIRSNFFKNGGDLMVLNCSSLDGRYVPLHCPIVFDVEF